MLASELTTAKEHLREAQAELQGVSKELTAALEKNDSLQKELVEVYKKAESTAEDLKEQKQLGCFSEQRFTSIRAASLKRQGVPKIS